MWSLPFVMTKLPDSGRAHKLINKIYFAFMLLHRIIFIIYKLASILLFIRLREPYFKSRT